MVYIRPQIEPVAGYPTLKSEYAVGEEHYKFIYKIVGPAGKMHEAQTVMLELGSKHAYKYPDLYSFEGEENFKPINYGQYLKYYNAELIKINPDFRLQADIDADIIHAFMHFSAQALHSRVGERMVDIADVAMTGRIGGFHTIYANLKKYFSDGEINSGSVSALLSAPVTINRNDGFSTTFKILPGDMQVDRFNVQKYKSATDASNYSSIVGIMESTQSCRSIYKPETLWHREKLVVDPIRDEQKFFYELTRPLYVYHIIKNKFGLDITNSTSTDIKELPLSTVNLNEKEREGLENIRAKISLGAKPKQLRVIPKTRITSLIDNAYASTVADLRKIERLLDKYNR